MSAETQSTLHLKDFPVTEPSICIPRVFSTVTKDVVASVIQTFNLGKIKRIDMIQRKGEKNDANSYQKVFIHFQQWSTNPKADHIRSTLLSGKEVKIIYDAPWFWKLSANKSKKIEMEIQR
jgi:hypothetical protein